MKTIKILAVLLGFLLMANSNVALAQDENTQRQDSIYGLEVSRENGTISFYSTYDMNKAKTIHVSTFDEEDQLLQDFVWFREESDRTSISFDFILGRIPCICEQTEEGVYLVNILDNPLLKSINITKIELYVEGEGFVPPSYSLRTENIGRSNVLTFFLNFAPTSLMELESDKNYTYKYFLLSGKESQRKPIGTPFVEMMYKNDFLISQNKYLIVK
jgi:hypothetical protein